MPQKRIANLMLGAADYGHTMAKFIILCSPNVIPIANKYLGFGYNGFFLVENFLIKETWTRDS
jgi:hypothetical protein